MLISRRSSVTLAICFALGFAGFGCATSAEDSADQSDDFSLPFGNGSGGFGIGGGAAQGQIVAGPSGVYSTIVKANGSGCPKGSWTAGISPDGTTFTVVFSQYETQVSPGQAVDSKDCALDVSLIGTSPLTFEVGALYYQGYVALDRPGMQATQAAQYSFGTAGLIAGIGGLIGGNAGSIIGAIAGAVGGGPISENEMTGPTSRSFTYADTVNVGKWSDCAPLTNLHIDTQLLLQNDPSRSGSGYLNDSTVDGTLSFGWKLNWKNCTPPPPPPPSCNASGVAGTCQDVGTCTGHSTPHLCPGPANIQCCTH
jgi:hypothetical protein